jgi:predicted nuclease of restriction endonuclease-like (RecB) superfamily
VGSCRDDRDQGYGGRARLVRRASRRLVSRSARGRDRDRLHLREAAAITNFDQTLEAGDAAAMQRITRDPLILDFVELTETAKERDLEAALLTDIERFMLALGEGFYFVGRQTSLQVGREGLILDLLFYHHPTRRFVVIDLKVGPFRAEFAGKMNL